jgi:hypothetical protein
MVSCLQFQLQREFASLSRKGGDSCASINQLHPKPDVIKSMATFDSVGIKAHAIVLDQNYQGGVLQGNVHPRIPAFGMPGDIRFGAKEE